MGWVSDIVYKLFGAASITTLIRNWPTTTVIHSASHAGRTARSCRLEEISHDCGITAVGRSAYKTGASPLWSMDLDSSKVEPVMNSRVWDIYRPGQDVIVDDYGSAACPETGMEVRRTCQTRVY
jgi:hypothetical protein